MKLGWFRLKYFFLKHSNHNFTKLVLLLNLNIGTKLKVYDKKLFFFNVKCIMSFLVCGFPCKGNYTFPGMVNYTFPGRVTILFLVRVTILFLVKVTILFLVRVTILFLVSITILCLVRVTILFLVRVNILFLVRVTILFLARVNILFQFHSLKNIYTIQRIRVARLIIFG